MMYQSHKGWISNPSVALALRAVLSRYQSHKGWISNEAIDPPDQGHGPSINPTKGGFLTSAVYGGGAVRFEVSIPQRVDF